VLNLKLYYIGSLEIIKGFSLASIYLLLIFKCNYILKTLKSWKH